LALFAGQVGTQGFDENKAARTNTQSYYRPSDAVIIQAATPNTGIPASGTEQKFVTAAANGDTTDIEVEVGYNTPGDWLNYTRTFGTGGSAPTNYYNVWCYLATSGSGVQASFSQVTSDPTQANQTTTPLGNFGTASFSDASYNSFVYVPLVTTFGDPVTLALTNNGQYTFRSTVVGNPNLGFYLLVPALPIYRPVFQSVSPVGAHQPANHLAFTVSPAQGASIPTSGIGVILNGGAINTGLSFTPVVGGGWTVGYPILSNELYTVIINVTNSLGVVATYSSSFDTFDLNNFHWMAADYDYSTNNGTSSGGSVGDGWTGGLFIDNALPTGDTNAPNSQSFQFTSTSYYGFPAGFTPGVDPFGMGSIAQQSIDYYWPTNANQDPIGGQVTNAIYRAGPYTMGTTISDGVGTQVAGDSFLLPEFVSQRTSLPDNAVCEFNVGYFYATNWLNYTRTFPTSAYNVWGRLGAGSAFNGATLSRVTSGVGTSNQTTVVLGTFSDPSPAGYQVYHWIQLMNTNGDPAVVNFAGKATLKLTAPTNASSAGGALNPLFFMLAPAAPSVTTLQVAAGLNVQSSNAGGVQISIPTLIGHTYAIMFANSLPAASWTQVGTITGNGSVQVFAPPVNGSQGFYQVVAH
jgi:hypothetical protein